MTFKLPPLVPGTPEQNALWDYVYQYGHIAEGVHQRLEKVCKAYAIEALAQPAQQPLSDERAEFEAWANEDFYSTQNQIIEWACKSGLTPTLWHIDEPIYFGAEPKHLEAFAALVAAHEREQCALVCEDLALEMVHWPDAFEGATAETMLIRGIGDAMVGPFAAAIRARGTT